MTNPKLATRRLARLPARIRAGDDEPPPPRGRIVVHGEHVCGRAVQFTAQLKRLPSYSMVVLCLPGLNRRWRIDCARGAPGIQGGHGSLPGSTANASDVGAALEGCGSYRLGQ